MLSLKITTGFSFEPEITEQMRGADGVWIAVLRKSRTKLEFISAASHALVMATIVMSLRDDPNIQRFVNSADHFCELLEVQSINADGWVEQILKALSDLYSSAHHLPDNEISKGTFDEESYDVNNNEWKVIFDRVASIIGEQRYYWEYFDPSEPIDANNEPVVGDLADDLADIYRDIKPGLRAWDDVNDESLADVVFGWKYPNFGSHWGDHALSAMRVLHPLCFMRGIQNDHSKSIKP